MLQASESAFGVSDLRPFRIEVAADVLDDLRRRLAATRWIDALPGGGWEYGTDVAYLRELCDYWEKTFDWRAWESRFNRFDQSIAEVQGLRVHFLHVRSPEPDALPLVMTHGWPGSIVEFLDVLGPLTDPASYGADPADAFHLVVPSLPGFGFSGPTTMRGVNGRVVAEAFAALMRELGYSRYGAQGGDIGAQISALLGEVDAAHVAAVHLNLLPIEPPMPDPFVGLSPEEARLAERTLQFLDGDTGYWKIQGTRPHTVGSALNDSPAGLAAWIVDKFRAWTDCDGDVESAFSKDQLLANITLYWVTATIASSARWYYENAGAAGQIDPPVVTVPTGYADFPGEHYRMPVAWARDRFNLVHVREMPRGGHFAAMQVPDLFVDEVRSFFREHR